MSLFINTNINALNGANNLKRTNNAKAKASARLSSGKKINSASDDAAGLAISEKMKAQIRGLRMAEKNVEDGMSLLTVQDGGTEPGTNPSDTTDLTNSLYIQSGANANQGMYISRYDCRVKALGIDNIVVDPRSEAERSLNDLDSSMSILSGYRATNGAEYNRLEYTRNSLGVSYVNLEDANSRIADADMAKEMMVYTKQNALSQAAVTMLVQANQSPEMVLQLLK